VRLAVEPVSMTAMSAQGRVAHVAPTVARCGPVAYPCSAPQAEELGDARAVCLGMWPGASAPR
jgi:hypothetical protein